VNLQKLKHHTPSYFIVHRQQRMIPDSKDILMNQEITAAETLTALFRSPRSSPSAQPAVGTAQAQISTMLMPPGADADAGAGALLLPAVPPPVTPLLRPAMLVLPDESAQNTISPTPTTLLQQSTTKTTSLHSKDREKNFPEKLLEILETSEHSDILKWLPGCEAFIIVDKTRFGSDELPSFLKQTQYTSFTRKLCRWKFVRVPRGPFIGAYYHKLFRRNRPALCKLMSCSGNFTSSFNATIQSGQQMMNSQSIWPERPNAMEEQSVLQQNYLRMLEDANRVSVIKEQLLNIRLKRAHLYKQHKVIRGQAEDSLYEQQENFPRQVSMSQATERHPQARQQLPKSHSQQIQTLYPWFPTNGSNSISGSRILQGASRSLRCGNIMEYNTEMPQLVKLRQAERLDRSTVATQEHDECQDRVATQNLASAV